MSTQLNRIFFLTCRRRRTLPQVSHRQQLEQKGLVKHSIKKVGEKEKSVRTNRKREETLHKIVQMLPQLRFSGH